MTGIDKILEEVKEISIKAGKAILDIYNDELNFDISQKEDESPLTAADKKANDIICEKLVDITPDIPIISEENKEIPYSVRKKFKSAWLVDPLDGTKEFIKRNGEFTVNIALIKKNQIEMGVVYVPVSGELFWAIKGEGAYYQKNKEKAKKLKCKKFNILDKELKVVCSRSHLNEATISFISNLDSPIKISKGSSLKFLVMAQGKAHVYPRLAPTMEWDTGAAHIILEEAGGKIIDVENDQSLKYNKEVLRNPHFIAYGNIKS